VCVCVCVCVCVSVSGTALAELTGPHTPYEVIHVAVNSNVASAAHSDLCPPPPKITIVDTCLLVVVRAED